MNISLNKSNEMQADFSASENKIIGFNQKYILK